ncbi:hypothetical protein ABK040_001161 [Willaertia magna]
MSFDLLLCTNILLFSYIADWPIIKPHLISSNFNAAFHSLEFSKLYLINLFQLNENEMKQLQNCITLYNINNEKELESEKRKKKKKIKRLKKDKIKHEIENLNDILKIYSKYQNYRNNLLENSQKLICNYKLDNNSITIRKAKKLLKIEKININLDNEIISYIEEEDHHVLLFGNSLKGIFVHKVKKKEHFFTIQYTVFTNCGFPISICISFNEQIDNGCTSFSESVFINSKPLFTHNYNYDGEFNYDNGKFREEYSESVLNELKIYLFNDEVMNKFKTEELNIIVYGWLQLGLFKFSNKFEYARGLTIFGKLL